MISPKMQKSAFLIIIILMVLFLPLASYSVYLRFFAKPVEKPVENPDRELYYNGKLWFYNALGEVIGTYTCEFTNCHYAVSYENDIDYPILYHKEEPSYIPVINDQFVFIEDHEEEESHQAFLYDIKNDYAYKSVSYTSVKNYQIGLENNYFIVENEEHRYGILQIDFLASLIVPYNYDFIGIIDQELVEDKLPANYFVVREGTTWNIMDLGETKVTQNIEEAIMTYDSTRTVFLTKGEEEYHVLNSLGNKMLEADFKYLEMIGSYIVCRTVEDEFYLYDTSRYTVASEIYTLEESDTVRAELNELGKIELIINGKVVESVTIT